MKTSALLALALALTGACSSATSGRPSTNDEQRAWVERDRQRAEADNRPDADHDSDDDLDGTKVVDVDVDSDQPDPDDVADEHAEHDVAKHDQDVTKHEPDNTGRNARDDEPGKLTALDQSNSKSDVDITQAIRKKVIADDALSFDAKNVKIITVSGKVTLRGPVESAKESAAIEKSARAVAGVVNVDNQIEVER